MIPAIIGPILGALGSLGSSAIGAASQGAANAEAMRLRREAAEQYGIPLEQIDSMLRDYGVPESALAQMKESDEALQRQRDVFSELEGINAAGGMDGKFRAALNAAQGSAQAQFGRSAAGIQKQLLSDAGMRGSPLQYALKSQAASDAANLGGKMSMAGLGQASDLRMQALMGMEGMSGRMRDQDFRAASQRAQAQDELNRWNREMSMRAVDQQSRAIEANNAGKRWAATGRANALGDQAAQDERSGMQAANYANAIGSGLGYLGGAAGQLIGGMGGGGGSGVRSESDYMSDLGDDYSSMAYRKRSW